MKGGGGGGRRKLQEREEKEEGRTETKEGNQEGEMEERGKGWKVFGEMLVPFEEDTGLAQSQQTSKALH